MGRGLKGVSCAKGPGYLRGDGVGVERVQPNCVIVGGDACSSLELRTWETEMRGGIWMSLSLLALSACAGQNIEPAEAELSCMPYAYTDQVLAYGKSHVIMLGEIHGTNESPEALEQLVCSALQAGEPVRVGLEVNWSQGIALNEAATLPVDRAAMLEAAPMMWGAHDGRSSVATFELLEQIATWKAAGHDVSVFAFDGEPSEWIKEDGKGSPRDETMARQVDLNLKDFDGVTVLLAGSFHVRKTAFSFGDEAYVPMATHVTERPVFSLRLKHGPGEFWINGSVSGEDGTMVEFIGPYETRGNADEDTVVRQFDLQPSEDGFFDGYYNTGPISMSPPAFPDFTLD